MIQSLVSGTTTRYKVQRRAGGKPGSKQEAINDLEYKDRELLSFYADRFHPHLWIIPESSLQSWEFYSPIHPKPTTLPSISSALFGGFSLFILLSPRKDKPE